MAQATFLAGGVWLEAGSEALPIASLNIIQVVGELNIFTEFHVAVHAYALVVPADIHVVEGLLGDVCGLGVCGL